MYLTKRIRLLPTAEQEKLFWKSAGVARWSYNFFLSYNQEKYNEHLEDNSKERFFNDKIGCDEQGRHFERNAIV